MHYNPRIELRALARCRMCYAPMLFIYDNALRDYCHGCLMEPFFDEEVECTPPHQDQGAAWVNQILLSLV